MQNLTLDAIARLTDTELVRQVKSLVSGERRTTAHLIAHLAVMDTRDIHLREGYSSLFAYCRDFLGMSEAETSNRIEVARAARRFPVIFGMLAEGAVHLTAVRLLAPHLTDANHQAVLEEARGKRKTVIEEIVARLAPRPDGPVILRKLADAQPVMFAAAEQPALTAVPVAPAALPPDAEPAPRPAGPVVHRPAVTALAPERYRLHLTIGGETRRKLERARDLLRHSVPRGDDAVVLDRALDALIATLERTRNAATSAPRPPRPATTGSRHIPAAVKRAVSTRDAGACAFVAASGHRCGATAFVEYHHRDPYVLGGETSVDNIELRCRAHNAYEGRLWFGDRTCSGTGSAGHARTTSGEG
jgi:hypothetical protein